MIIFLNSQIDYFVQKLFIQNKIIIHKTKIGVIDENCRND